MSLRDHLNHLAAAIALACLFVSALFGLAEGIHHAGMNPFADASGTGLSQVEPFQVSPLRASIPSAGDTQ